MAVEFNGAKSFQAMARQLHQLSKNLQQVDEDAVADEMEALKPAVRRSAQTTLPARGGLARKIASSDLKVQRRTGRVSLRATNASNIRRMNEGTVRHPVFARANQTRSQWRWVDQRIPKGWFDNPTLASEMRLRRVIEQARQRAIDRVR